MGDLLLSEQKQSRSGCGGQREGEGREWEEMTEDTDPKDFGNGQLEVVVVVTLTKHKLEQLGKRVTMRQ